MRPERLATQRHLAGLRLHMADAEVVTKYAFPFIDAAWSVAFVVVDVMAVGPRVFRGPLELRSGALYTTETRSKLETVSGIPSARFDELVHFDPWWASRGIAGVDRAWVDAILASNLAGTFNHQGTTYKVHDLEFDAGLRSLEALVAKDLVFRTVSLHRGDVELRALRHPVRM